MENNNILQNLFLKQFNDSNAIAYNKAFVAGASDYSFQLLDNAYRLAGKYYASLKIAIESNKCESEHCAVELKQLKQLEEAPQASLDFLSSIIAELTVTEESSFDPNNDYRYAAANSVMAGRPGFSKTEGYNVYLNLIDDGSQSITFEGPLFQVPLIINNNTLLALIGSGTDLIATTPDINKDMLKLLTDVGVMAEGAADEEGNLLPGASISDEFVLKNSDGSYDYEIIDILSLIHI